MKKITGIILCAVIISVSVVSFMSCGAKSDSTANSATESNTAVETAKETEPAKNIPDNEKIIGKWKTSQEMGVLVNNIIQSEFIVQNEYVNNDTDIYKGLKLDLIYDFKEDGTLIYTIDDTSYDSLYNELKAIEKKSLEEAFKHSADNNDKDLDAFLELMEVSSIDEYIETKYSDENKAIVKTDILDGDYFAVKYKVEDGKLFMTDSTSNFDESSYAKYEFINDRQLKITMSEGYAADSTEPIILNKQ